MPLRHRRSAVLASCAAVVAAGACARASVATSRLSAANAQTTPASAHGPADAAGAERGSAQGAWQPLFVEAGDLSRWRGYKRQDVPAAWRAEDGALKFVPVREPGARGDLISREQYGDFELQYEWRVVPGANSGVMWRVSEDGDRTYHSGPEMQVLDDERHADGKIPSHRAGALYDLVVPPANVARPVGQYNQARIVARGGRVQLFLNGTQTADFDFASDAGKAQLAKSKFAEQPTYARFARNARGHVALQDHGDTVYFRNVRIRALGGAGAR